MPENEEAVRRYLEAATSGSDDAYAALGERVADDATASSPLASGTGPEAVLDGLRRAQPMLAAATWADPVVDGDAVKVAGTLPPGSVLGTATLTFRFDGDGRITQAQQARTFLQIQGRGRVEAGPQVRDVVFDNGPEREQSVDPDRLGVAVVVDVDRVQGRLPDGPVNMSGDAH